VTTCLENLESSGNLKHVRGMSGNVVSQGIVRKTSGEKSCHGKVSQNSSLLVEYLHKTQETIDIKYTNMHSFHANTLNNSTVYLIFGQEVLATM